MEANGTVQYSASEVPAQLSAVPVQRFTEQRDGTIYFLCSSGKVVYVGQTKRLQARIEQHRKSKKVFDSVFFVSCPAEDMDDMERSYIAELAPPYNVAGNAVGRKGFSLTWRRSLRWADKHRPLTEAERMQGLAALAALDDLLMTNHNGGSSGSYRCVTCSGR